MPSSVFHICAVAVKSYCHCEKALLVRMSFGEHWSTPLDEFKRTHFSFAFHFTFFAFFSYLWITGHPQPLKEEPTSALDMINMMWSEPCSCTCFCLNQSDTSQECSQKRKVIFQPRNLGIVSGGFEEWLIIDTFVTIQHVYSLDRQTDKHIICHGKTHWTSICQRCIRYSVPTIFPQWNSKPYNVVTLQPVKRFWKPARHRHCCCYSSQRNRYPRDVVDTVAVLQGMGMSGCRPFFWRYLKMRRYI